MASECCRSLGCVLSSIACYRYKNGSLSLLTRGAIVINSGKIVKSCEIAKDRKFSVNQMCLRCSLSCRSANLIDKTNRLCIVRIVHSLMRTVQHKRTLPPQWCSFPMICLLASKNMRCYSDESIRYDCQQARRYG